MNRFFLGFFLISSLALSELLYAKDAKSSIKYESRGGITYEVTENISFSTAAEHNKDPAGKTTRIVMQKTVQSKLEVKDGRDMQELPNTSMELKLFRVEAKAGDDLVKPIGVIKNDASAGFFADDRFMPLIVMSYAACCAVTESFEAYSLEGKLIANFDGSTFYRIRGLAQDARYLGFLSSSGSHSSMAPEKGDLGILTWAKADGTIQKISLRSKKSEGWGMAPAVDIAMDAAGAPLVSIQALKGRYFEDFKRADKPLVAGEKPTTSFVVTLTFKDIGTTTIPIENDRLATSKAVLSDGIKLNP